MDFDPAVNLTANAESHGASGYRVEEVPELSDTLATGVNSEGPSVVNVLIRD